MPIAVTPDVLINLDKYNAFLGLEGSLATFQAGARVWKVNEELEGNSQELS